MNDACMHIGLDDGVSVCFSHSSYSHFTSFYIKVFFYESIVVFEGLGLSSIKAKFYDHSLNQTFCCIP